MFKKIISYLIIFSIFSHDAAHCGNVGGRESSQSDEEESNNPIPVRRKTTENAGSTTTQTERTPLTSSKRWTVDTADIPPYSMQFNFQVLAETGQGKSPCLLPHEKANDSVEENFLENHTPETSLWPKSSNDSSQEEKIHIPDEKAFFPSRRSSIEEIQETKDTDIDASSTGVKENNSNTDPRTEETCPLTNEEELERASLVSPIKRGADSSSAPELSINANFKAINKSREEQNFSQWMRTTRGTNSDSSDQETQQKDAPGLTYLREETDDDSISMNEGSGDEVVDMGDKTNDDGNEPTPQTTIEEDKTASAGAEGEEDASPITEDQQLPPTVAVPLFVKVPPSEMGYPSVSSSSRRLLINGTSEEEMEDFMVISQDFPSLSSYDFSGLNVDLLSDETKEFLRYIKVRVVDGKLNWKQYLGVLGGLATGGCIALPAMLIFEGEDNSFTARLLVNIIYGLAATFILEPTFRTISILVELTGDQTSSFLLQKSSTHKNVLGFSKTCIYGGSIFASLLPMYYLNNISSSYDAEVRTILWSGAPAFLLYVTLHYGHHLSHPVEHRLHHHFFHDELNTMNRQQYLRIFKDLKTILYNLRGEALSHLYSEIFLKKTKKANKTSDEDFENLNTQEALRILHVLRIFHGLHAPDLTQKDPINYKKTIASFLGWGITALATVGRHLTFWYVVNEVFEGIYEQLEIPYNAFNPGPIILGGIIAGFIQGLMEKESITKEVYNVLCGKKIPNGSSHYPLRILVKLWNYIAGFGASGPYIFAGFNMATDKSLHPAWPFWVIGTCLFPFGMADVFTKTNMFHESTSYVINGFDSLISYCYPFQGYKRDKLIHMTRQFHKLFKELHDDVLDTVDQLLNHNNLDDPQPYDQKQLERQPLTSESLFASDDDESV